MTGIQPLILRSRRLILFKLKQCGIIGSTSGCINGDGVDRVVEIVLNVKRRERERERLSKGQLWQYVIRDVTLTYEVLR